MLYNNLSIVPPVIAHRGASAEAPENTLMAFIKAKQLGINWVEFDVTITTCGEVVVFHDDDLERTSNGFGKITSSTYEYLQTLDAASWFDSTLSNVKIPTLAQVLELLDEHQISANIEIKAFPANEAWLVDRVFQVLEQHKDKKIPLLISSFSHSILQLVRKRSADIPIGVLMDSWDDNWLQICDQLSATAIDVNYHILTLERAVQFKQSKLLLLAYTVNDAILAQKLYSWGVDAIFSDCSQKILSELRLTQKLF